MRIKASRVREFAGLLRPEIRDEVMRALKAHDDFSKAFAWKTLSAAQIRTEPYQFLNNDLGVHLFDVIIPSSPGCGRAGPSISSEINIGTWRPGRGDQDFNTEDFCYRVTEIHKDGVFRVWRAAE
jgi:hypothetical protein